MRVAEWRDVSWYFRAKPSTSWSPATTAVPALAAGLASRAPVCPGSWGWPRPTRFWCSTTCALAWCCRRTGRSGQVRDISCHSCKPVPGQETGSWRTFPRLDKAATPPRPRPLHGGSFLDSRLIAGVRSLVWLIVSESHNTMQVLSVIHLSPQISPSFLFIILISSSSKHLSIKTYPQNNSHFNFLYILFLIATLIFYFIIMHI